MGDLLREEGFSLQGNAKTIEGRRHLYRDAQFRYISEQVKDHQGTGDPVISVDTKKKELVAFRPLLVVAVPPLCLCDPSPASDAHPR